MGKTKFWSFKDLRTCRELEEYISERIDGHNYFYHYTSANNINSILESNCFFISSVKRLNDKKENFPRTGEKFTNKYYTLCFSTGKNENLSLWYLYSGIDGHGGRIELTKNKVHGLMNSSEFSLWECDTAGKPIKEIRELTIKKDIFLELKDVVYEHTDISGLYCDMKYNTMTNYTKFTVEEMELYKKNNIGFVKSLIWYYEKEARILATLSDEIVSLLNDDTTYLIKAKFDDTITKSIKITFAPEVTDIYDVGKKYPEINKHIKKTCSIHLSDYNGDVAMKLFNSDKFKEELCLKCEKNK